MRVLLCGLGDIARKAYLPVLASTPGLEVHLATRDSATLASLGTMYRISGLHSSLDDALATTGFDAAFVHSATAAHPAMVETLLRRGIPVFVDKPLADSWEEAERLVDLAVKQGCLLRVGFNRRYAPGYAALRDTARSFVLMEKHRHAQPDTPRRVVFDDFIHVVDTLRFLAPVATPRVTIETIVRDRRLHGVTMTLAGDGFHAVGTMQRDSGLDEERLTVIGDDRTVSVSNMSDSIERDGVERHRRRGDWTPVARQRGFEAMCADFLDAVRTGLATDAADIVETHRLCEAIVRHADGDRRPLRT